jgi:F-type H+-transporting ATPase subunit a
MTFDFPLAAAVPLNAQSVWHEISDAGYLEWLTNSIFVAALTVAFILLLARKATARMTLVPTGTQNIFEAVVETLYDSLEGIVGKHMISRVFSLLASLFIFILVANWFSLLPGVGSIGWGEKTGFLSVKEVDVPLLRPATADLNMTLALALIFMVLWLYWSLSEVGLKNFIVHIFGVKGGMKGLMALALAPLFIFVGLIEVISISFRPVSLSLRLFGNIFAGETLLTTMILLGKELGVPPVVASLMSIIVPIPFYFLELLVGLLQAIVFTLLCAVYIQLSTSHDEEEAH